MALFIKKHSLQSEHVVPDVVQVKSTRAVRWGITQVIPNEDRPYEVHRRTSADLSQGPYFSPGNGTYKPSRQHPPPLKPRKQSPLLSSNPEPVAELSEEHYSRHLEIIDIGPDIAKLRNLPSKGSGGSADLFAGLHNGFGWVAIRRPRMKQLQNTAADVIENVLREVALWRTLRHKSLLPLFGVYRMGPYLCFLTPFIENGSISQYTKRHPEVDLKRLLCETAEALAYLHQSGLIHGDIKGCNILVSDSVHALLSDFGSSRLQSLQEVTELESSNSARWLSPEVLRGSCKTTKSDVWAFGMTIYEVLSGRQPFNVCKLDSLVALSILDDDELPPTRPMFAPSGMSYHKAWRAAIYCWNREAEERISMAEVVRMLTPAVGSIHTRPGHTLSGLTWEEGSDFECDESLPCYCDWTIEAPAVECSNIACEIRWFHRHCIDMEHESVPESWLCLVCEAQRMATGAVE